MNIQAIRKYASKARRQFFDAIISRAASLGITPENNRPDSQIEEVLILTDHNHPREIELVMEELYHLFRSHDFYDVIERTAYTWFNRLVALRYMEVHNFLESKILSQATRFRKENILTENSEAFFFHSQHRINLQQLIKQGRSNEQIYRYLLVAQCNELHNAMPFLFEEITPGLATLLPENLLAPDSIIMQLVTSIEEEVWLEGVEIIGWLYQYYIAEKKRELTGKLLQPKEIPAATQLFTPRWIVRYLVQNTLGKKWLETSDSPVLRSRWEFFIPDYETKNRSKSVTRTISEEPESLTILDPACGSGHILVEAYDTLKDMYLEHGYSPSEIPYKILEKNLYGLDIDERATQMASFALLMRARIDEPNIINGIDTPVPHIYALNSFDRDVIIKAAKSLLPPKGTRVHPFTSKTRFDVPSCVTHYKLTSSISVEDFERLADYFSKADIVGSLTIIPDSERDFLVTALHYLNRELVSGDLFQRRSAFALVQLVLQAIVLSSKFDCVLANPPYMGSKYQPLELRAYLKNNYLGYNRDLFSAFFIRNFQLTKPNGYLGFMSPFVWMFIGSYRMLREFILRESKVTSLIKLQYSAFEGATVPVCTFTLKKDTNLPNKGAYLNLETFKGRNSQSPKVIEAIQYPDCGWLHYRDQEDFFSIPGTPLAFWLEEAAFTAFKNNPKLGDVAQVRVGIQTSDNTRFLRRWHEVDFEDIGFDITSRAAAAELNKKWIPYNKGGRFRQWYGNHDYVINFKDDGADLKDYLQSLGRGTTSLGDPRFQFVPGVTWSDVSSSYFGARFLPSGFLSDISGSGIFAEMEDLKSICCYLCSSVAALFVHAINPTLHFQTGNISSLPTPPSGFAPLREKMDPIFDETTKIMSQEWGHYEEHWQFGQLPFLPNKKDPQELEILIANFLQYRNSQKSKLQSLEYRNNSIFAEAFGLHQPPDQAIDSDSCTYPEWSIRDCVVRLISFSLGTILGRYRLGMQGIQNTPGRNQFCAKEGYIVLSETSTKDNRDAFRLLKLYLSQAFGKPTLQKNLEFIANSLDKESVLSPEEQIRSFLAKDFFKAHFKMYSKRPLYWEISSGSKDGFKALVYSQLLTPFTLKAMRDVSLKIQIDQVSSQLKELNTSNAQNRKILKQLKALEVELVEFSKKLDILVSERISLNLDDGVKANYLKLAAILTSCDITKEKSVA